MYKTTKIILAGLSCCLALTACASQMQTSVQTTKRHVNLNKYAGRWYELASFPAFFQRDCICTQAFYRPQKGYVQVINSCHKKTPTGEFSVAKGKAFVVPNSNNSKLKVQFFWPFKGDYWILYLSPNYKYAVVGNPKRNYLWILSRTPRVSKKQFNFLKAKASRQGFDVSKLNVTPQNCRYRKADPTTK